MSPPAPSSIPARAGSTSRPATSRWRRRSASITLIGSAPGGIAGTPRLLELSPQAIVVFVTNPVDVVTYAAGAAVTAAPGRVFGSGTVLDSSRFRFLIAQRANLAVGNVHGAVIGEHGDSEIPLWSSVSVGGVPAAQFRSADGDLVFDEATRSEISATVVNAAYQIIAGKGATNLAIGLSTARIVEAILGDERRVLPVSAVQWGAYGITGVALPLPTVVSAAGAGPVLEVPLSGPEMAGLRASADTLRDAQRALDLP